jgi:penicillin-insensitive murein endopeptidase
VVLEAYAALEKQRPGTVFVYGETGLSGGGRFRPHKTHQNGLSVDFMVPVKNGAGESVPLPTWPTNKFGYSIDFDPRGRYDDLAIDFEAMALHIESLSRAAAKADVGISRVIFDPKLQPYLHETEAWPRIAHLQFSKKRSWVRHDEHYHIGFELPCEPLANLER